MMLICQSDFLALSPDATFPEWTGQMVDLGSYRDCVYDHNVRLAMTISFEFMPGAGAITARGRLAGTLSPMGLEVTLRAGTKDPVGSLRCLRITDSKSSESLTLEYPRARPAVLQGEIGGHPMSLTRGKELPPWLGRDLIVREINRISQRNSKRSIAKTKAWRRIARFIDQAALPFFCHLAERVSSGRAAPERTYALSDQARQRHSPTLGPALFNRVDPAMVDPDRRDRDFYPFRRGRKRKPSLSQTLKNLEIATKIKAARVSPYHSTIDVTDNVTRITSNLIDIGYGASQVIPVVQACLSGKPGPLFIEQPEIHLHPRAQGTLANLIGEVSLERQVIVETHSEHMINRARLMVARGKIPSEQVVINYVERDQIGSHVIPIRLGKNGDFEDEWPRGFFDERYQDTVNLMELRTLPND